MPPSNAASISSASSRILLSTARGSFQSKPTVDALRCNSIATRQGGLTGLDSCEQGFVRRLFRGRPCRTRLVFGLDALQGALTTGGSEYLPSCRRTQNPARNCQGRSARPGVRWNCSARRRPSASTGTIPARCSARSAKRADEIEAALDGGNADELAEETGDLLFALVNLARHVGADPGNRLGAAPNAKFERRFAYIERRSRRKGPFARGRITGRDGRTLERGEGAEQSVSSVPAKRSASRDPYRGISR